MLGVVPSAVVATVVILRDVSSLEPAECSALRGNPEDALGGSGLSTAVMLLAPDIIRKKQVNASWGAFLARRSHINGENGRKIETEQDA